MYLEEFISEDQMKRLHWVNKWQKRSFKVMIVLPFLLLIGVSIIGTYLGYTVTSSIVVGSMAAIFNSIVAFFFYGRVTKKAGKICDEFTSFIRGGDHEQSSCIIHSNYIHYAFGSADILMGSCNANSN